MRRIATLLALFTAPTRSALPSAQAIIQRSVQANAVDWAARPHYSWLETDRQDGGSKTYQVSMIDGSPYRLLVALNGKPLPPEQQQKEERKRAQAIARRRSESPEDRAARIARYMKDRNRDHFLMQQLTQALDFQLLGEQKLNGFDVYVLKATPRAGYQPPNMQAQVLTGMEGKLWIDQKTFQWVKIEADVVRPVTIEGFLARVEPGTRFELEKTPVSEGVWLPKHFAMISRSKILLLFNYGTQADQTFSDYKKNAPNQAAATPPK